MQFENIGLKDNRGFAKNQIIEEDPLLAYQKRIQEQLGNCMLDSQLTQNNLQNTESPRTESRSKRKSIDVGRVAFVNSSDRNFQEDSEVRRRQEL